MPAYPQQIQPAQKFNGVKQQRVLAQRAGANDHQQDIKPVAQGYPHAQPGAAAQAMAGGESHQQKEIRARAEQGDEVRQRERQKSGREESGSQFHSDLINKTEVRLRRCER